MEQLILLTVVLLITIVGFLALLLLEGYVNQRGGTMEDRKAVVFEVYRYTICMLMMVFFTGSAFILFSTLLSDMEHPDKAAGPGIATVLCAVIFAAHWMMPNPAAPKVLEAKPESAS